MFEQVIERLNSYVFMSNLSESGKYVVKQGENFHTNGLKINNYIKLSEEIWEDNWFGVQYRVEDRTYLEILYTEKFITLRIYLKETQIKEFNILKKVHQESSLEIKSMSRSEMTFSFRFDNKEEFFEFFDKYIFGQNGCILE